MDDEILQDFLVESEELIANLGQQLVDLEAHPDDGDLLNAIFRCFHTVKGGAGFLNLEPVVSLCHVAEELCNGLRADKFALNADIVDALSAAIDHLQDQHAALAAGQDPAVADPALLARLAELAGSPVVSDQQSSAAAPEAGIDLDNIPDDVDLDALLDQMHGVPASAPAGAPAVESGVADEPPRSPPKASTTPSAASPPKPVESSIRVDTVRLDAVMNLIGELVLARNQLKAQVRAARLGEDATRVSARIDRVTTELQGAVMKIRMQAIRKVFSRFPRIVRDLARSLGKDVVLELQGEDTELDKNLVEALSDPLVHLVRNAVDHGIETPQQRLAAGKPAQGTVQLSAAQEGDDIVIRIVDDGAGMDPNRLRAKAVERGVLDQDEAARMDSADCFRIIFMAGFSTRDDVSDISGRGVGMDVVKNRIDQLNGHIHIDSVLGQGSTMELRLPLTLAIMASLMVRAGQRIFSVPLSNVDDVLMFDHERHSRIDGRWVYRLDDDPVPVLMLGPWCGEYEAVGQRAHMVLMRSGGDRFGLVVDSVIGREEVVIKPLGPPLTDLVGFSGATVTGDGRVALILDPVGLLKSLRAGGMENRV